MNQPPEHLAGGIPVADANAPINRTADDLATASHTGGPAMAFEDFDLSDDVDLLIVGTNVLAIHGLNVTADSRDMLVLPELTGSGEPSRAGFRTSPGHRVVRP